VEGAAPRREVARVITVSPMHDMRVALGYGAYDVACVRKYIDQLTVGRILGRFAEFTILLRRHACAEPSSLRSVTLVPLSLSLLFSTLTFFLRRPPSSSNPIVTRHSVVVCMYRVIQHEPRRFREVCVCV